MPSRAHSRRQHRGVLEELLAPSEPPPAAPPITPPTVVPPAIVAAAPEAPSEAATERFSASLPVALVERARTAVFFTPGLTLSALLAEALAHQIDRLEHERGQPFPADRGKLRTGRPVRLPLT
jgi:hypothetical protein